MTERNSRFKGSGAGKTSASVRSGREQGEYKMRSKSLNGVEVAGKRKRSVFQEQKEREEGTRGVWKQPQPWLYLRGTPVQYTCFTPQTSWPKALAVQDGHKTAWTFMLGCRHSGLVTSGQSSFLHAWLCLQQGKFSKTLTEADPQEQVWLNFPLTRKDEGSAWSFL